MTESLRGQRVLVVGAAGGIGRATAMAFASAGAAVSAAGRTPGQIAAVAEAVGGESVALDVLDNDAIERFFAGHPAFDHVVVAAASTTGGPVARLSLDDAKASMESKFWGAYRVARACRISEHGSITFVSGMLSQRPSAASVLQGAINAALEALARGLALERAPVRVNTVSPGIIDTPLHDRMPEASRAAMFDRMRSGLPVRRLGQAEDVAQAILFAASNPFVTGSTINVDGGGRIM
ncbi:SDR family oxidoreductase [Lichenicoccus roseus]|uniref:SDR family oxidoreductase n=1 Tax=Lichenicoccus roseus TaxID=2683649 RepID=A0A5R9J317_9PROT|nr:SDR family oxidoreductase [Lichenicoccus roseus]TLU72030.1 SDR family oxidoreductase [Lichenicoccus roseus]